MTILDNMTDMWYNMMYTSFLLTSWCWQVYAMSEYRESQLWDIYVDHIDMRGGAISLIKTSQVNLEDNICVEYMYIRTDTCIIKLGIIWAG